MRHLYQLSKDFNHTLFGNALATIKMVLVEQLQSSSVASPSCFAWRLPSASRLSPIDAFALVPSALLIAMVPISLAGWGVREVVFIQAFSLAGIVAEPGPGVVASLWARRIDNRPARWRSLARRATTAKPIGRALFDLTSRLSEEFLHELLVVSDMGERRKPVADRSGKDGKAVACVGPTAAGLERGFDSSEILRPNLRGGAVGCQVTSTSGRS